ncbi:PREDICTED: thiamin pyrophosphokinase 1-like [Amphimedon queenslandica]|uniref:Thiamine pyrophosphokinase n=1 Tax=Amphimedon queenslandica TaxID=400682 RepID=A0A1X7VQP5_AMPQE|nr:PREDICTED: thiamin pyrophosphokinase 1-like [Amphimedon queenslandica]|eukprot:XP_011407686.1 PREDICTED: thiamin pyrophosphokinase 1-like [Amphimedon queenslandica]
MECSPLHIGEGTEEKQALLLLNNGSSLGPLENFLLKNWKKFAFRVCADGGSNSLHDTLTEEHRVNFIPNVIIGDMDSIRPDVKDYYESKKSEIIRKHDQDSTDFSKALTYLSTEKPECATVYVLNRMWGRFDQMLGNVHELYKAAANQRVYLVTEDSVLMLLNPGTNIIHLKRELVEGHCGIIPLGESCDQCWTTGLEWNLDGEEMKIGGLISTCNLLKSDLVPHPQDYTVTIKCTHKVVFSFSHKLCNV